MSIIIETSAVQLQKKRKAVAVWLLAGVGILIVQILLGGITRLTGSGLSITEWKPIMGALPPMNESEWQSAFEKYQHIAQYKYLNAHFSLSDFKSIFFWEWFHRQWARIALFGTFTIGFVYFLVKKYFDEKMIIPFVILFILGGLQGVIGWLMVKSGLNDTDLYVSHIRLAVHFIAALVLLCYTLWFAMLLLIPEKKRAISKSFYSFTIIIIAILAVQLTYGAFMAGLKAASTAATWPSINGSYLPENISKYGNTIFYGIDKYISHPLMVHFMHRTLAYILCALVIGWYFVAGKHAQKNPMSILSKTRLWPMILVVLQVVLGIFTVLTATKQAEAGHFGTFEIIAELHQMVAMLLLVSFLVNVYVVKPSK